MSQGILYLGRTLTTAVAETIVRDRFVGWRRRLIAEEEILDWGVTEVHAEAPLALLDLTKTGLVQLGVPTNAVRGKTQGRGEASARRCMRWRPTSMASSIRRGSPMDFVSPSMNGQPTNYGRSR